MKPTNPLVSICIPLYNEEDFIVDSLKSAMNQSYENIEIIISDNHSSDTSLEKIEHLIKDHKNIILLKQKNNIGAIENFNYSKSKSRGDYFMWLGAHDIILPNYVQSCLDLHNRNKNLALVYTKAIFFSNSVKIQNLNASINLSTVGLTILDSAKKTINAEYCTAIHGVFNQKFTRNLFLKKIPTGPDNIFLFEASLLGNFEEANLISYKRRVVREIETETEKKNRYQNIYKLRSNNPLERLSLEYFKVIANSKLSKEDKKSVTNFVLHYYSNRYHGKKNLIKKLFNSSNKFIDKLFVLNLTLKILFKKV